MTADRVNLRKQTVKTVTAKCVYHLVL